MTCIYDPRGTREIRSAKRKALLKKVVVFFSSVSFTKSIIDLAVSFIREKEKRIG